MRDICSYLWDTRPDAVVLILHDCGAILLKPTRHGYDVLAEPAGNATDTDGLRLLLSKVVNAGAYHSQPITLILATGYQYTYIKVYTGNPYLPQLQDPTGEAIQAIGQLSSSKVVVVQGIDKGQMTRLRNELNTAHLPLITVMTLPAHALITQGTKSLHPDKLIRVRYGSGCEIAFAATKAGSVAHSVAFGTSAPEWSSPIREHDLAEMCLSESGAAGPADNAPLAAHQELNCDDEGAPSEQSVNAVWQGRTGWRMSKVPWLRWIALTGHYARRAALLALPLAIVFSGLSCWGRSLAGESLQRLARADAARAEHESLVSEIDSLLRLNANRNIASSVESAPLLSLFCQRSWPGVRLKSLSTEIAAGDTLVVVADGMANRANRVLDMKAYLDSCVSPRAFVCERLRPVAIVKPDGRIDTLSSFSLRLVVHD